jgi:putative FmdB family regulatory protein
MPTYDYRCTACAETFEVFLRLGAPNPQCRACGGETKKIVVSPPAVSGEMARGRDKAMRSLPECGKGCRCCP